MGQSWYQLDWVWTTTGWVLAGIGAVMLLWALFGDRARGRRRCPKCWYDMAGAVSRTEDGKQNWICPECGKHIKRERQLYRTHRRWKWASAACLVMILSGAVFGERVRKNGWWSLVPTWTLVDVYPLSGPNGVFGRELFKRLGLTSSPRTWNAAAATATDGDKKYLLRRIRYGNIFANPHSTRWRESFGEMPHGLTFVFDLGFAPETNWPGTRSRMSPALVPDLKRLYELPLDVRLVTRTPWPIDVPLFVCVDVVNPWPWPTSDQLVIRRKDTGEKLFEGRSEGFVVSNLPKSGVLDLEVEIYQWKNSEPDSKWTAIERRQVSVPFRIAGTSDAELQPVTDKAIDELVAGITYHVGGGVSTDVLSTQQAATRDIAFGVIMEHRLEGKTLCRERAWWPGGEANPVGRYIQREWIDGSLSAWTAKAGEKWTIHIVGDRETALRVVGTKRYWAGEADIDVSNFADGR